MNTRPHRISVRELTTADGDVLDAVFAGLSLHSRHMRFHSPIPQMTPAVRRTLADVDGRDHIALGAFAGRRCEPVGLVRLISTGDGRAEPRPTSRRVVTPSLCSTADTWWSTVRTDSTSFAAISAFVSPRPSSATISSWRTVSPDGLLRVAGCPAPPCGRSCPSVQPAAVMTAAAAAACLRVVTPSFCSTAET